MMRLMAITVLCTLTSSKNYIINGDFESPFVLDYTYLPSQSSTDGWYGHFDLMGRFSTTSGFSTRFIDTAPYSNGFIAQNVTLPK